MTESAAVMRLRAFDAVIFDLDGVVTDTARVHAVAWQLLFDDYLRARGIKDQEPFRPFSVETDYPHYIDGKPRYEGVRSFLASRRINLALGDPADGPDEETICALGNRKDRLFADVLRQHGVDVFESTVRLIRDLEDLGVRRAVASSSKNCRAVLDMAGIADLFEARVDGVVSAELGLSGKPAPDIFLKSAELLGVPPTRTVIVEDAVAGVEAGRNGSFALVIGVNRAGLGETLRTHGADVVVPDLAEVRPEDIDRWCRSRARRPRTP